MTLARGGSHLYKQAGVVAPIARRDGPIVAQCGRRRGPRHLGVPVHGRVHTTQLLEAIGPPDLDDGRPVDPHAPLGHVQPFVAYEWFLEEGPSAALPMGLHQCRLKRGVPPFDRRRPAPTLAIYHIVFADRKLNGGGEENET